MTHTYTTPEILAPAGNFEKCSTALLYGADAVYLGGSSFNLRASTDGFTTEELHKAVALAHQQESKIYYTLNAFPKQNDMHVLPASIEEAAAAGIDAFIIADPGILRLARKYAPDIPIHLSTQANTSNAEAVAFWADLGICRVNIAREVHAEHIASIRQHVPHVELEVFVHGAMCLALSGKCLLSAWLNKRSANEGRCTHPCRFEYKALAVSSMDLAVAERTRQDDVVWHIREDEQYSSFWAPHDLCLIHHLPWFIEHGIHSLKIEGRMKGSSYVAHVVDAYVSARNAALKASSPQDFSSDAYFAELYNTASRPLCSGFFLEERVTYSFPQERSSQALLARVSAPVEGKPGSWHIEVRGNFSTSRPAELMLPGLHRPCMQVGSFQLSTNKEELVEQLNSGMHGILHVERDDIIPGIFIRGV